MLLYNGGNPAPHPLIDRSLMEIKVQRGSIEATSADVIIVNLFEGTEVPAGGTGAVDKALNGAIADVVRSGDFRGKLNELSVLYSRGALPAKRVIVAGLGSVADFNLDRVRRAAAWSARRARDLGCKSIATVAHGAGTGQIDAAAAAQAVVEGALLGLYEWREHRNAQRERGPVESLTIVEFDESKLAAIENGAKAGEGIAAGVNRARDLINEPPNYLLPKKLAEAAVKMAEEVGVKCVVHDIDWMREQKMGALLGVTQ